MTQVISPRREAVQPPSWDSGRAQREVEAKYQPHGERRYTDQSTRRCKDEPKAERVVYMQYQSIKTHQSKVRLGKSRTATPISEQETRILFKPPM